MCPSHLSIRIVSHFIHPHHTFLYTRPADITLRLALSPSTHPQIILTHYPTYRAILPDEILNFHSYLYPRAILCASRTSSWDVWPVQTPSSPRPCLEVHG